MALVTKDLARSPHTLKNLNSLFRAQTFQMKIFPEVTIPKKRSRPNDRSMCKEASGRGSVFNAPTKGIGRRFRTGLALVQKALLLGVLVIGCKEEAPPPSPTTEKKEGSPVLRASRMTEWVLKTYDSIEKGFAKAESELTRENPNIEQVLNEVESLIMGKAGEAAEKKEQLASIKKELIGLREEMSQMSSTASSDRELFKQKISDLEKILDGRVKDIEEYDLPLFEKLSEDFQERLNAWKIALVSFRNASSENAGKKMAKLTSEYFHNELGWVIIMRKANWGDTDAQFNLGLIYEKGLIVPKNHESAIKWHLRSEKGRHVETRAHIWKMYVEKGDFKLAKNMLDFSGEFPEVMLKLNHDADRMVLLADYLRYGSLHLSLLREKKNIENALADVEDRISERASLERESRETLAKISRNMKILEDLPQSSGGSPLPWTRNDSSSNDRVQSLNTTMDEQSCYETLSHSMSDLIALYKRWNAPVMEMRTRQLEDLVRTGGWERQSALFLSGISSAREASKKQIALVDEHVQNTKSINESLGEFLSGTRHTIESINLLILDAGFPALSFKTNLNWFPESHQIYEITENDKPRRLRISMDEVSKELIGGKVVTLKNLISEHVALNGRKDGMSPRVFSLCIPSQFHADLRSDRFSDLEMNNLLNLSALLEQCSVELTASILYCMMSEDMHEALLELGKMASEGKVFLGGTGAEIINRAQKVMREKTRSAWVKDHGLIAPLISDTEKLRASLFNALREISSIAGKDEGKDPMETMWKLNQVIEGFLKNWKQFGYPPIKFSTPKGPFGSEPNFHDVNRLTSAQKGNDQRPPELSSKRYGRIACMHRRAVLLSAAKPKQFLRFMEFASYHYLSEWSVAAKRANPDAILLLSTCYRHGLARPQNTALSNQLAKLASELKYKR